jgi:glycosyltransferase involved in cell wall biosynthesis
VNLLPQFAVPRHLIRWAMTRADMLVAVSEALKRRLVELGGDETDVRVLRNGVDCDMFRPMDRLRARALLDVASPRLIVSIGNLVPEKGHDLVIGALPQLSDTMLVIVGDGPERAALERLAHDAGVAQRVRFLPVRSQPELTVVYNAADALVLASSREGWPNVLLEAMACGTPVAATNVGGVPEIVDESCAGILVRERTGDAIAAAVGSLLASPPNREAIRHHALRFGWDEVARSQREIFRALLYQRSLTTRHHVEAHY